MTRQATRMFGVDTVEDYLAFCGKAVAELEADQDNVLPAFAAILALNHIPDWLRYKLTGPLCAHVSNALPGAER